MEKAKKLSLSEFEAFKAKYPLHEFKYREKDGAIQRKYKSRWVKVCIHNRQECVCKDCGGASICKHDKIRSHCKPCGGGSICKHDKIRSTCKQCGGGSICKHDMLRSKCKKCDGGSICDHKRIRAVCKECNGGSICDHKKRRSDCKECKGNSICVHDNFRSYCKACKGSSICKCGDRVKVENGLCNHCNPDFVFSGSGCSKSACKFIDSLEIKLGIKIQHVHLDLNDKVWTGSEHRPDLWQKKPIDGYYLDGIQQVAIEFLGDYYHGHPRFWGLNKVDKWFRKFEDLFLDTENKLKKLKSLGYKVYYVWESETDELREFIDKLEYKSPV